MTRALNPHQVEQLNAAIARRPLTVRRPAARAPFPSQAQLARSPDLAPPRLVLRRVCVLAQCTVQHRTTGRTRIKVTEFTKQSAAEASFPLKSGQYCTVVEYFRQELLCGAGRSRRRARVPTWRSPPAPRESDPKHSKGVAGLAWCCVPRAAGRSTARTCGSSTCRAPCRARRARGSAGRPWSCSWCSPTTVRWGGGRACGVVRTGGCASNGRTRPLIHKGETAPLVLVAASARLCVPVRAAAAKRLSAAQTTQILRQAAQPPQQRMQQTVALLHGTARLTDGQDPTAQGFGMRVDKDMIKVRRERHGARAVCVPVRAELGAHERLTQRTWRR